MSGSKDSNSSAIQDSDEASSSQKPTTERILSSQTSVSSESSSSQKSVTVDASSSRMLIPPQQIELPAQFHDYLRELDDPEVLSIVESVTFDQQSRRLILQLPNLLRTGAEGIERRHSIREDTADERIRRLSESYRHKYPELLKFFKDWKSSREELVGILSRSSNKLVFNSNLVSAFRISTSVADILGTIWRGGRRFDLSIANLAMEYSSTLGILALFVEMTLSKKMHRDVKKAIRKDQLLFSKIREWFQQTEELDSAVRSFFPYGIDVDIVRKINTCAESLPEYDMMFMSIVASNAKQNVNLFKDKQFLEKANRVAESDAGKHWFHRAVLENDPYFKHSLNSSLTEEIQNILEISPVENREMYVEACRALSSKVNLKITVNLLTIISAASNLMYGEKTEESENFRNLARTTKQELVELEKAICHHLRPSDFHEETEENQ